MIVAGRAVIVWAAAFWPALLIWGTVQVAAGPSPELTALDHDKQTMAAELARQVAYCSARQDTSHPAFKGCIDWHSAVHGVWALLAYQRATGDAQYAPLVGSILNKEALSQERAHLKQSPLFEMPYGRAWFLRLAIEHHRLTGSEDLLPFADEVAFSLRDFYRRRGIDRLAGAYQSASWALINLLDYARHRHLAELEAEVRDAVKTNFVDVEPKCASVRERGEFMAICSNWAALVARVLTREDYAPWLEKFIAMNGLPTPLVHPDSDHEFGLNFSRAWGLWDMYAASGRADVAAAYAAHLKAGYLPASNWRGSYQAVGHWVAQFGLFALQPLFGPEAGR
jgi:Protein of unknown function (DUF2891)